MEKVVNLFTTNRMDGKTKARLEELRHKVPRYLFRAWTNSPGNYSGGYPDLNTTRAITPLAFKRGKGHSSVYDLTKEDFTNMAIMHLCGGRRTLTALSSWTASLYFAMGLEKEYISIIDTKAMWSRNQIFFVPDLEFLSPGNMHYDHEYLAHGIIEGPFHRAMSMDKLLRCGLYDVYGRSSYSPLRKGFDGGVGGITEELIRVSRWVGEQYGGHFTLPTMLAIISWGKRYTRLIENDEKTFQLVFDGIDGLHIPHDWSTDETIMKDVVYTRGWGDIEQMIKLMRAIVQASQPAKTGRIDEAPGTSMTQANGSKAGKIAKAKPDPPDEAAQQNTKDRKKRLRSAMKERPIGPGQAKAKTWLERELKRLEIDMKDPWMTDEWVREMHVSTDADAMEIDG